MSPGIKVSAGLFIVALPVMLYLTSPGLPMKAAQPITPATITTPVESTPVTATDPTATIKAVRRSAESNRQEDVELTVSESASSDLGHQLNVRDDMQDTGTYPSANTEYDTGNRSAAGAVAANHAESGNFSGSVQSSTAPSTRVITIIGKPSESPENIAADNPYLSTAESDYNLQADQLTSVECPKDLYMGGNAYGQNMLTKMGCP